MNKKRCFKMFLVALAVMWGISWNSMSANAATEAQKSEFVAELEEMLYSADTSTHYVYNYKLTTSEFNKLYDNMKNGDCRLIIASYYSNMRVTYKTKWFWIESIQITNVDSDVLPRYERLKNNVVAIQSGIEEDMTDLDKIIYLHDTLVDLTSYKFVAYQSYGACGALGDKLAVCAGYTKAYNMLLDMNGIEAYYAEGDGIDHGWTYVKLDGEWYHVDTTWDDVQGGPSHQYLLRNDKEFVTVGAKSHVAWTLDDVSESSTSTRFSDWYVHDIKGKMSFEDGQWYYVDVNNDIVCADALGNESALVLDGANLATLTLVDVEDGMITYKVGSVKYTELLKSVGCEFPAGDSETKEPEVDESETENSGTENSEAEELEKETNTGDTSDDENSVDIGNGNHVLTYNFNEVSVWRSGRYNITSGIYEELVGYICTNEMVECESVTKYAVTMEDTRFRVIISEYAINGAYIKSTEILAGEILVTDKDCNYINISMYMPAWPNMPFAECVKKLTYHMMSFELTKVNVDVQTLILENDCMGTLESINFNTDDVWRNGAYNGLTGFYVNSCGYICTKQLLTIHNYSGYEIVMKDANFHVIINEYGSDGSMLASTDFVNGDTWIPNSETTYVGVSMHYPGWRTLVLEDFIKRFNNNYISLEIVAIE